VSGPLDDGSIVEGLVLRDERPDDDPFLRALYASTRSDELAVTGWSPAQVDGFLRMQFDLQRAHYRTHFADARFLIVERDGRPIGRLYVSYTPADVRVLDIALVPDTRGNGVGRQLLEHVIDHADRVGAPVTLHVAVGNRAQRLYERLGFRTLRQDPMNLFMERPASRSSSSSDRA
jgi:ribosomal protein S18 acetylase RimI-like enzyme